MQVKLDNNHWLVIGTATKDADYKIVGDKGTPMCMFSLAAGKRQDTTTIFANGKAWRSLAKSAGNIQKGDIVAVIGTIEENDYNGKKYTNLVADWLNIVGDGVSVANEVSPSGKPYPAGVKVEGNTSDAFSELDNGDGKLPF